MPKGRNMIDNPLHDAPKGDFHDEEYNSFTNEDAENEFEDDDAPQMLEMRVKMQVLVLMC